MNLEVSVSKIKKGIFHSNNGGYLHFDVIVLNRLIFYHESIEVAIDTGKVKLYTYAKLMCCATEELEAIAGLNPTYIILDEFHRVGAECWGASTLELLKKVYTRDIFQRD